MHDAGTRPLWLATGAVAAALATNTLVQAAGNLHAHLAALLAVVAAGGLLAAVALIRRGAPRPALLLLGAATVCLRVVLGMAAAGPATSPDLPPAGPGEWRATVVSTSGPSRSEQRAMLRLEEGPGIAAEANGGAAVYAWLPRFPPLVPGDRLRVGGSVEPVPDEDDGFASFLRSRGAIGTLRARRMELVAAGAGPLAQVERLRRAVDAHLARGMPEPEAGLAAGILVGLRERVARDVADDFTTTGLSHVVAISGWNIALVAGVAGSLLAAAGLGRRSRSWIIVLAILAYTLVAGAGASVVRAAAMGGIAIVLRERGRPADAVAALGVACWGLVLLDPAMAADIGFQLSVAATGGLLAFAEPLTTRLERVLGCRAPRWLTETLGVSLAAQAATLPLILLHFGRLSLVSPVANLLVAPVVAPAMLGALTGTILGLLADPLPDLLAAVPALASWLPLTVMVRVADVFAALPFASVELPEPIALGAAAATAVALLAALRRSRGRAHTPQAGSAPHSRGGRMERERGSAQPASRSRRMAVGMAALVACLSVVVVVARPPEGLRMTVLDVGQGDAILLEGIAGSRLLVDGGPDPDLLVRRLDERLPAWDRRIDLALLTHPHEDHAAGLAGLPSRYRVSMLAENGMRGPGPGHAAMRDVARTTGIPVMRLAQGDRFDLDGAMVTVVWPPRGSVPVIAPGSGRRINDASLVLEVTVGSQRLLLTGDIEDDMDAALVEALGGGGPPWDALKVAHHGSATATSEPFLAAIRPRAAVVSAGRENTYGHPAPSTLARLAAAGARIFRTDRDGSVSITLDGRARAVAVDRASGRRASPIADLAGEPATLPADASARRSRLAWKPLPRVRPGCGGSIDGWPSWRIPPAPSSPPACYARGDGRSHEDRSGPPPARAVALSAPASSRHGRRGGGLLPGHARRRAGGGPRPPPRRGCRPASRHRQGPAALPSAGGARSWICGRPLAGREGARGALAGGRGSPGHAAHGSVGRGVAPGCGP
jgi:competence protein ComEC